ncbi:hypothetical protein EJ04DRAFT_550919 [Polyplosphaeria fusca]|uniref:Uncharacterized protein n=1 Tax=Polyplosphaeria fusca TaxID=682080 RepID=A0A9P4V550_9PLEO|nr:hypothetical protein EJ04DRAFT_550919 [Polyplosphaeria fusca]
MLLRSRLFPHPPIFDNCEFSSHLSQIDDRLAYRIGCPLLPALPVQTKPSDCQALKHIPRKTIDRILARIGPCEFELVHRFHRGQEPSDDNVTFLVLASYRRGYESRWKDAVHRLRAVMPRNSKITVEIVDKQVTRHLPPPKEIRSNQSDILEISQRLLPTITSIISQHQWITVDILNWYLPPYSSYHPTVVISARDTLDDLWWSTTLPKIRRIIKETGSSLEVVLLFLDCLDISATPLTGYQPADTFLKEHFYDKEFAPGTSCGLMGSNTSGTLGGFVVVEKGGEQIQLGLTNCHVLLRDAKLHLKDTMGLCSKLEERKAVSPSDVDHEVLTRELQGSIDEESEMIKQLEEAYGEEELSQSVKDRMERHRRSLKTKQNELTTAKSHDRFLGTIFATSGFTTWPPTDHSDTSSPISWALDWCLIRLGDKTRGRITAIDSTIHPGNGLPQLRRGESTIVQDNICGFFDDKPVMVHTVVSTSKNNVFFIQKGDSGSIVLLNKKAKGPESIPPGTMLGIVFASNRLVSYMIPMEIVVKSIESVTGGKVVQPQEWTSPT